MNDNCSFALFISSSESSVTECEQQQLSICTVFMFVSTLRERMSTKRHLFALFISLCQSSVKQCQQQQLFICTVYKFLSVLNDHISAMTIILLYCLYSFSEPVLSERMSTMTIVHLHCI